MKTVVALAFFTNGTSDGRVSAKVEAVVMLLPLLLKQERKDRLDKGLLVEEAIEVDASPLTNNADEIDVSVVVSVVDDEGKIE